MRRTSRCATAIITSLLFLPPATTVLASGRGNTVVALAAAGLSAADQLRLTAAIARHRSVRLQLPPEHQALLDQLTACVGKQLFAIRSPNLLASATQIVSSVIPGLNRVEVSALAVYALDGVAADDTLAVVTKQMQETQMSFNMQYLQLQMQNENRAYTAISNIMETKHDTVKNSISKIR